MNPTVLYKLVNIERIMIILDTTSICELDRADYLIDNIKNSLEIDLVPPVYWFCRLKAKVEKRGDGSFLMDQLLPILDDLKATVVNAPNPYGEMSLDDLIKFYKKYGFITVNDENLLIRFPKRELPFHSTGPKK